MKAIRCRIGGTLLVAIALVLSGVFANNAAAWKQSGNNVYHTGGRVFVGVDDHPLIPYTDAVRLTEI